MNNVLLYISIVSASIALVLAVPIIFDKIISLALNLAHKTRKNNAQGLDFVEKARAYMLYQIETYEAFEKAGVIDATAIKADAIKTLEKCNKLRARLEASDALNDYYIRVLEKHSKTK